MNIREEQQTDLESIESLTYQAFENHPHHAPGEKPTEHMIVNRLRNDHALTLSLVAEENGVLVGQISFSPVTIDGHDYDWYGLGPVSVLPTHQGKGVGSQLILKGLQKMKDMGAKGLVLLGDPEYYGRFGFKENPALMYPGVPAEYFVVLPLENNTNLPTGNVSYHKAFN